MRKTVRLVRLPRSASCQAGHALLALALGACPSEASDGSAVAVPSPSAKPVLPDAQAKAELDEGHWERAAVLYGELVDASARSAHDRAFAEQQLGVCLVELGLRAAALAAFEDVIAHAAAPDAIESVRRVARFANAPESELSRVLGELPETHRGEVIAALGRDDASRVHFLRGTRLRSEGKYPEAIAELGLVDGPDAARAQIAIAIAHVSLRHSVPAAEALRRARELASKVSDAKEAARITERSLLLEGELFYSSAMTTSEQAPKQISVNRKHLNEALALWSQIPPASELAADAAWQRAWVTFTLGDYAGTAASLDAAAKTGAYLPEAELLGASTRWATKDDKGAKAALDAFLGRYAPVVEGLHVLQRTLDEAPDSPAGFVALTLGRDPKVDALQPAVKASAQHALGDKVTRDAASWIDEIEQERGRIESLAESTRQSHAADRARLWLDGARTFAAPRFRALASDRLLRESDELGSLVRSARSGIATVSPPPKRR
jgi:tetratricopeptide (TPR) repeat protein